MAPLTNINDLVTPQTLQGFVETLQYPQFELQEFLPDLTLTSNTYRYDTSQPGQEPAVEYRAWDTETPIGDRRGVTRASQELPPLGKKKIMTEEQFLKLQAIQTGDFSAYIAQIYADIDNLVEGVNARWELDRGELLGSGSLTVRYNSSEQATVTYPVPGGNIVTAGTLWSDTANADPLVNMKAWVTAYKAANKGLAPGVVLISDAIAGYLLRNDAIRSSLYMGAPNSGPSIISEANLQEYFRVNGLPPFRIINSQATKADGTYGYVLPQNKVIMLPGNGITVGRTVKGITATGLNLVQEGTRTLNEAPGIVGLGWEENDPAKRYNMVDACGMPVISNASMLFIATVAA